MFACGHESGGVLFILNIGSSATCSLDCLELLLTSTNRSARITSGLGLLFAFSQPVTKSMPPAVTPSHEDSPHALCASCRGASLSKDLAVINGWDLTCDKATVLSCDIRRLSQKTCAFQVGRYLAPFAYAVVSSSYGFSFAVLLSGNLSLLSSGSISSPQTRRMFITQYDRLCSLCYSGLVANTCPRQLLRSFGYRFQEAMRPST